MIKIAQSDTIGSTMPKILSRSTNLNDSFAHRLTKLKRPKAIAVNYHVQMAKTRRQEAKKDVFQDKYSNSLQIPISMTHRQSPSVQPNTNKTNSLLQTLFSPKMLVIAENLSIRSRQKSMSSQKSNTSTNSKQNRKDRESQLQNQIHLQAMKRLKQHLNDEVLQKRLGMFSKQSGKNFIRVYKEDIHKIIQHRYSKDRITTFLDTEYIEDFQSVQKTMNELTSLKQEEMLVFCFLIMDQNKDGLITVQDLLSLLGLRSKTQSTYNPLITQDVIRIYDHVEKMKEKGDPVMDSCSNDVLKDECLTFMKYRIAHFKENKQKASGQIKNKCFLSCRLHSHLYTLRQNQENQVQTYERKMSLTNVIMSLLGGKEKKEQCFIGNDKKFAINFKRFSQIFNMTIPKIFLDFLYLLGGLQVPGEQYMKVDNSILIEPQAQLNPIKIQEDKMKLTLKRLEKMFDFKKNFRVFRIKTES